MCEKNLKCQLQKIASTMNIREIPYVGEISKPNEYIKSSAIKRNPSKCILCGNCVEVCNQVQDVGILKKYWDFDFVLANRLSVCRSLFVLLPRTLRA